MQYVSARNTGVFAPKPLPRLKFRMSNTKSNHRFSLWIFLGLVAGVLIGLGLRSFADQETSEFIIRNVLNPIGQIFLRGLFMIVVPLVFSCLFTGVAQLGSAEVLGRLGTRLFAFYMLTTLVAVIIGQVLILSLRPGDGIPRDVVASAQVQFAEQVDSFKVNQSKVAQSFWPGMIEQVVPRNILSEFADGNMLAVIFVALLFGIAAMFIPKEKSKPLLDLMESLSEICMTVVGWMLKLAPFAVAALVAPAIVHFGLGLMKNLLFYAVVVFAGYALHLFGVYGLIVYFLKIPVGEFFKRMTPVMGTAFSTSSSNASIPLIIRTLEKSFGVPERITNFTIPMGATLNSNGTALFEVVAALFIAQVFGIDLSIGQHFTLIALILLMALGVAGVPGGSIPLLMTAMAAVGIPAEGIALILGVDRLLDMGRTVLNVVGDTVGALYLCKVEKVDIAAYLRDNPEE